MRTVLLIAAVLLFLFAAFDVSLGELDLQNFGLAAFAGSFLVPDRL